MARADASAELARWSIESLVPGGDGMAVLADGRVAFAAGALPGDVIRPLGVEMAKGAVRATRWELVQGSPHRVEPECKVAARCGGCDWMALVREEQLVHKGRLLETALARTGKLGLPNEPIAVQSPGPSLHYRDRVRLHVSPEGRIGFFERKAHAVVEFAECLVCRRELNGAIEQLRSLPPATWMEFSEVELRYSAAGGVSAFCIPRVSARAVSKNARTALARLEPGVRASVQGNPDAIVEQHPLPSGLHLNAFPGVFTQVNWTVNVALVTAVVQGARARGVRTFCDAYAGAGNFSLPLLAEGMRGISIERDARAVTCAVAAAREQGLDPTGFVEGSAAETLADLARTSPRGAESRTTGVSRAPRFDLVILDPPRSGAREALSAVARLAPAYVAYCSCDPVTLARDLGTLAKSGYAVTEICGFDMFPQTHHLETLAWLARASER